MSAVAMDDETAFAYPGGFRRNGYGFVEYALNRDDFDSLALIYKRDFYTRGGKVISRMNGRTVHGGEPHAKAGIVGELVFEKFLGHRGRRNPNKVGEWDFSVVGVARSTTDVKCKNRNVEPRPDYEGSFFAYQRGYRVHYYAFASTLADFSMVWLCGWISKAEFFSSPHLLFWKKGEVDASSVNKLEHADSTYGMLYRYMHPFRQTVV